MKKLLTILLLFPLLISCSKDDDNIDNTFIDKDLIGVQWKLAQGGFYDIWVFNDTQKIGYAIRSEIDMTMAKIVNGTFEYKTTTDGNLMMDGKTYVYKIEGEKLYITGNKTNFTFTKVEKGKEYRIIE